MIPEAQHNELGMNEDSNETMNEDKGGSRPTVRFLEPESVEKACNASGVSKIKNVKLADVLQQMTEQNPTQVVQKMLQAVVSDITVEDILTSGPVTHKLMFKLGKPDIISRIPEIKKVNINSLQTFLLFNVLYSFASSRAIVKVEEGQVSALIDTGAEVNLVKERILQKLNVSYTVNGCLWLVDINGQKTVLHDICKNVEIQIGLIEVLQSLLIVEKVSQLMVLDMSYQAATSMMTQSDSFSIMNIEISSPHDGRKVKFQAARRGSKTKFLLHLFSEAEFKKGKD